MFPEPLLNLAFIFLYTTKHDTKSGFLYQNNVQMYLYIKINVYFCHNLKTIIMKTKTIICTLALFATLGITSCNNEKREDVGNQETNTKEEPNQDDGKLTEAMALAILSNEPKEMLTANIHISDLSLSPGIPDELKRMEEKGLATYTYIPVGTQGYGCYGKLTEKGQEYVSRVISNEYIEMMTAKIEPTQITGMREIPQNNSYEVEYIEQITIITPIGEICKNPPQLGQSRQKKAVFYKYTDGWRIKGR
jgi:DNA-binding PadR family transcriptional regulator